LHFVIAAAGLLLYVATLNPWLTFKSLPVAVDITHWRWQPMLQQPVLLLLTWPLSWLPAAWIPPALNVLAAVCASVALGLVARSVALLRQRKVNESQGGTPREEQRPLAPSIAWIPPVLAAVALGLQLTFWENATGSPADMLELLLFAGGTWCLVEYRCDPRLCWLDRASFLCGLALANSWAVAGFLPLFAAAIIWSKRLRFFNVRFLQHIETSAWRKAIPALASDGRFFLRMFLFGLAGLSLILLLPLLNGLSPNSSLSFWQAVCNVAQSYEMILHLLARVFRYHKEVTLLLATFSLMPVLVLSIQWRLLSARQRGQHFDPVSFIVNAAHAFLLAICIMIAFDPVFSPRQLSVRLGIALPFLPLYYLNALSLGYYAGYFLLIFSGYLGRRRLVLRGLRWFGPKLGYALLGLMLLGLLWRNLPVIRVANGRHVEHYARFLVDSLPPERAVVFGFDSTRLGLLQVRLDGDGKAEGYVVVDANALTSKDSSETYRAWLRRKYPKPWTELIAKAIPDAGPGSGAATNPPLDGLALVRLMDSLAHSNRVWCLEANYGIPAEVFCLQPRGLTYEVKAYPADSFNGPPLTAAESAASEAFWQHVIQTEVDPLAKLCREADQRPQSLPARLANRAHITPSLPDATRVLARWYSGAVNSWGVLLQRRDQRLAATNCFAKAVELNPDNLPARVNLQCDTNLAPLQSIQEQLDKHRNAWAQVLAADGPLDDPTYCYWLGIGCLQLKLPRQAGQLFERAHALAPKELYPSLVLGDLLSDFGMPDRALRLADEIQADLHQQGSHTNLSVELAFMRAKAWLMKTNQPKAREVLETLLNSQSMEAPQLDRIKAGFVAMGSYTNALRITDLQLRREPDNPSLLHDKGFLYLTAGDYSNAIPAFTRLLSLTNIYSAFLYRGQAYMQATQFDAAVTNYLEALQAFPLSSEPCYRLAEIFFHREDTNTAKQWFQKGLTNALELTEQQLQRTPDHAQALMDKGILLSRVGRYSDCIPVFTRVLSLTNSYGGRLFRALAYVETQQLDAAEADCLELLRLFPAAYEPYSGLAEVALRRGNTNAAIQRYQQFLSKAPTNQVEFQQIAARVKSLQSQVP
jgi:tetratricopeptide (TPR) repeat protein